MGFVWRVALALLGLLLLRGFVYPRGWGRRRFIHLVLAIGGIGMAYPLIIQGQSGQIVAGVAAALILLPYRSLAALYLRGRTRAGLRRVAERWGTKLTSDRATGLWQVTRQLDGRRTWAGNVLTHIRSIHRRVRKSEVGYMLAFVIELPEPPPFQCSLMYGWKRPRYFEREWRTTYVAHGNGVAMSLSDLLEGSDKGRETGGKATELSPYPAIDGARHDITAIGTEPQEFARVFSGELIEQFNRVAVQTYPYELNVTPTSVSVYTTYCDGEAQQANVELLEKLVARLTRRPADQLAT